MQLAETQTSTHQLKYALMPRTTLSLDQDIAVELDRRRRERGTTLKHEVNELLRAGLDRAAAPSGPAARFETRPLALGKPRLDSFDDIAEVIALAEGEEHR